MASEQGSHAPVVFDRWVIVHHLYKCPRTSFVKLVWTKMTNGNGGYFHECNCLVFIMNLPSA
jgi:hypothetical protein